MVLLTGEQPGSERETEALCQLIHQIHPAWVVSFTIRWPVSKIRATARWVAGWPTPSPAAGGQRGLRHAGPFGSWCADIGLPASPPSSPVSADEATERYLPAMTDPLRWQA